MFFYHVNHLKDKKVEKKQQKEKTEQCRSEHYNREYQFSLTLVDISLFLVERFILVSRYRSNQSEKKLRIRRTFQESMI